MTYKTNPQIDSRRRKTQRGSALLVVLVFAAIVAIMLYRELPVAAFEAQRQKEELLVSRGNEYKHAVKLFVRKVGRFPSSLDELENTNRMRFLRRRYVDPLTGKADWRLIHAGPGGIIIDSKVQTSTKGQDKNALGQGATFKGFNNAFSGDAAGQAEATAQTANSAAFRQRGPATKNAGNAGTDPQDPFALPPPEDPSIINLDPVTGQPIAKKTTGNGNNPGNGMSAVNIPNSGLPNPGPNVNSMQDQMNTTNPRTPELSPAQQAQQAQQSGSGLISSFGNSVSSIGNNNSANNSGGTFGNTSSFNSQPNSLTGTTGNGQIGGAGGIAGVASTAPGASIKTVNDQTKYKLWEFYYDLRKDQNSAAGAPGQQNGTPNGTNIQQQNANSGFGSGFGFGQGQSNTQSAFGSSGSSFNSNGSGFGSGSSSFGSGNSSFGSGSTTQNPPATTPPPPQ